jgi:hypothetical protein
VDEIDQNLADLGDMWGLMESSHLMNSKPLWQILHRRDFQENGIERNESKSGNSQEGDKLRDWES